MILEACPSFLPHWQKFLKVYGSASGDGSIKATGNQSEEDAWIEAWVYSDGILDEEPNEVLEDDYPLYIALGDLADHLCSQLKAGRTTEFPQLFDVVEQLLLKGDDAYVKLAASVGLLEDIQNLADDSDVFLPYLQPETLRWWHKLNAFWNEGKLLSDDSDDFAIE